jgi:glycosyltransferase involved in cell wall biosynthesis
MIRVSHLMFMSELPGIYPFSGLENHLMILLPALHRQRVDVEFIVMTWNIGPEMTARLAELEAQGVTVTILPCSPARQWRWLGLRRLEQAARLRPLLVQRRERIIHSHLDLMLTGVAIWAARCPRVVMSIHNDPPWLMNVAWRVWLRWMDRRVSHYIAISERVRHHYLTASGVAPEKVSKIYYGLTLKPVTSTSQEIRRTYQIPADRFVVGFVGRLAPQKNLPLLIAALEQLPDVHGVIIGDGELRQQLQTLVQSKGLRNVQFLGRQPDATEIIPGFDVLCLPSHFEGLGLVLVEAMLRRVGVIGSRAGAIPEILGEGQYGLLFQAGDVAGLIEAIKFAQREQAYMAEMVERAFEYAQRTFGVETMVKQILKVYEKMR